jgi:two-component system response regulator FixJ
MSSTRPLIAVVDDDQGMRTALRRLLSAANFDMETFPSGLDFLKSLQARQPDCVVLDMDMPQIDGLAVQERLTQAGIRLPVIVVTGRDSDATRARALAAGASAYLAKAVDGHTLLDAIAAAISQPPAPTGSAKTSAVNRHHPEPEEYDDRQPGNNG